jgi:hypothetical protein
MADQKSVSEEIQNIAQRTRVAFVHFGELALRTGNGCIFFILNVEKL